MNVRHDDPRLRWYGAVSQERTDAWTRPWRLPFPKLALFPPERLQAQAGMPAGVRLTFNSDTRTLRGSLESDPAAQNLDLVCNGDLIGTRNLSGRADFSFEDLPAGDKRLELWLPQWGGFRLKGLELDDGATLAPAEDPRPRWLTYGSSISQCAEAASPTRTWPAIVARTRGLNLTCLGFSGECHLDGTVARVLRDLPAEVISLCVGINIQGGNSLSERTFAPALIGFIQTVREGHPETPLVVVSPVHSPPREMVPNKLGLSLQAVRQEVAKVVKLFVAHGDANLFYVDGLELLGPEHAHLLPDALHPNTDGYRVIAENFLEKVVAKHFPAPKPEAFTPS